MSSALELTPSFLIHIRHVGKCRWVTEGQFCQTHIIGLGQFFFPVNPCVQQQQKRRTDESNADVDGYHCDVQGGVSYPKDNISPAAQ